MGRIEGAPPRRRVAGVIGELHGVDRPHLDAEPLQGEHRGGIADMAVGHMRLQGEDVHGRCAPWTGMVAVARLTPASGHKASPKLAAENQRLTFYLWWCFPPVCWPSP